MEHTNPTPNGHFLEVGRLSFDACKLMQDEIIDAERRLLRAGNFPTKESALGEVRHIYIQLLKESNWDREIAEAALLISAEEDTDHPEPFGRYNQSELNVAGFQFYLGAVTAYVLTREELLDASCDFEGAIKMLDEAWQTADLSDLPAINKMLSDGSLVTVNLSREGAHWHGQRIKESGLAYFAKYSEHWQPLMNRYSDFFEQGADTSNVDAGIGFMLKLLNSGLEKKVADFNLRLFRQDLEHVTTSEDIIRRFDDSI